MADSLSRQLSRFVAGLSYDSLPQGVIDKVKASLMHGLVMGFIGAGTEAGRASVELTLKEESRPDGASILGQRSRATRYGAAFANSSLLHTTNQGDTYRMLAHPGPCVIPSALAMAELDGGDGRAVLTALAAGYEVECRLAGDYLPSTQARGFRSSPVYGTFGAAAAAAKLRGLDENGVNSAIGWASTFTAGLVEGSHTFHEPLSARNGVLAAMVAGDRFPGSDRSLDGAGGFYNGFTGNNEGRLTYSFYGPKQVGLAKVAEDLGQRWELLHIVPKMLPTPGFNLPVIELMKELRREHSLKASAVESIEIAMNWLETSYPSPAFVTAEPGRPPRAGGTNYVAAYVCAHGDYPVLGTPNQSAGDEAEVRDLMGRVEVLGAWDRKPFAPRITVTLRSGGMVRGEYRGDELEWDMATEVANLRPVLPQLDWPLEKLEGIVSMVSELEKRESLRPLLALCVP